jgi:hypothetical protein
MTFHSFYVGSVDDAKFSWEPAGAKSPRYNLPKRITPDVPVRIRCRAQLVAISRSASVADSLGATSQPTT